MDKQTIEHIYSIELKNTLPKVFVNEPQRPSEVWRKNLTFKRGENMIIEAVSGTGKSSLCAYIFGSRFDYEGDILFNGRNVRELSADEWQRIRRNNIAYLPQELSLFPELTAIQNIELKNNLTHHASKEQIEQWLSDLGIDSRTYYPVGKMSIGQQQRVGIIRAICQPFDFLFLDEPVSHLDETNNEIAAKMIMDEANRQGASVIATSVGNHIKIPGMISLKL
jgi:ABC-type lipoprotein export system ATPase subunit